MSIFTGTTEECLQHFKSIVEKKPDYFEIRKNMALFTGVAEHTAYRWLAGKNPPVGESLVKLRYFLEHHTYEVAELMALKSSVRTAGRLYAFGVVSLGELMSLIGFPEGNSGVSGILATLRGTRSVSEERLKLFEEFTHAYGDQLTEKQSQVTRVNLSGPLRVIPRDVPELPPVEVGDRVRAVPMRLTPRAPVGTHEAIMQSFAGQLAATTSLAEVIASDEFTAEERARVRDLCGGDGVFKLANTLFSLCGERSRGMR